MKTKEELIKLINVDEPDYEEIAKLVAPEDVKKVKEISEENDAGLASKAISLLGLFDHTDAFAGIINASRSENPIKKIASAIALKNMKIPDQADGPNILSDLLNDPDPGVKKFALKAIEDKNIISLSDRLEEFRNREKNQNLKTQAEKVMRNMRQ